MKQSCFFDYQDDLENNDEFAMDKVLSPSEKYLLLTSNTSKIKILNLTSNKIIELKSVSKFKTNFKNNQSDIDEYSSSSDIDDVDTEEKENNEAQTIVDISYNQSETLMSLVTGSTYDTLVYDLNNTHLDPIILKSTPYEDVDDDSGCLQLKNSTRFINDNLLYNFYGSYNNEDAKIDLWDFKKRKKIFIGKDYWGKDTYRKTLHNPIFINNYCIIVGITQISIIDLLKFELLKRIHVNFEIDPYHLIINHSKSSVLFCDKIKNFKILDILNMNMIDFKNTISLTSPPFRCNDSDFIAFCKDQSKYFLGIINPLNKKIKTYSIYENKYKPARLLMVKKDYILYQDVKNQILLYDITSKKISNLSQIHSIELLMALPLSEIEEERYLIYLTDELRFVKSIFMIHLNISEIKFKRINIEKSYSHKFSEDNKYIAVYRKNLNQIFLYETKSFDIIKVINYSFNNIYLSMQLYTNKSYGFINCKNFVIQVNFAEKNRDEFKVMYKDLTDIKIDFPNGILYGIKNNNLYSHHLFDEKLKSKFLISMKDFYSYEVTKHGIETLPYMSSDF